MRTSLVLTIIGDDKPGIVEQLSDQILATGANWEESRMARLGGKFAGLLRLTVDRARADALTAELARSEPGGLTIVVEQSGEPRAGSYRTVRLGAPGSGRGRARGSAGWRGGRSWSCRLFPLTLEPRAERRADDSRGVGQLLTCCAFHLRFEPGRHAARQHDQRLVACLVGHTVLLSLTILARIVLQRNTSIRHRRRLSNPPHLSRVSPRFELGAARLERPALVVERPAVAVHRPASRAQSEQSAFGVACPCLLIQPPRAPAGGRGALSTVSPLPRSGAPACSTPVALTPRT